MVYLRCDEVNEFCPDPFALYITAISHLTDTPRPHLGVRKLYAIHVFEGKSRKQRVYMKCGVPKTWHGCFRHDGMYFYGNGGGLCERSGFVIMLSSSKY